VFCPKCGKEQEGNPNFCRSCGERLKSEANRAADIGGNEVLGDIEALQSAADYRQLRRELTPIGIVLVLFAIWALVSGILGIQQSMINGIAVLMGISVIIVCIWVIISPRPAGWTE